jgi:uncharacterized protein (DUF1501 family)
MNTLHTRRSFLRSTALGGSLAWTLPTFLAQTFDELHALAADSATAVATGKDSPILVVLQLAGGNDGLNTLVPFADDDYHRARPNLGLKAAEVLKLNDQLGLHPALAGFKELHDSGQLGIVQAVGYPNPNRSHFRSTEIWQTASDANKFERHGWIGRYFDHACPGADPTVGIAIGRQMPQSFAARRPAGVALEDPAGFRYVDGEGDAGGMADGEKFYRELARRDDPSMLTDAGNAGGSIGGISGRASSSGSPLDFLERTALDAQVSSDRIRAIAGKVKNRAAYPNGQLARGLQLVARLIGGGMPTRIYYVSQGGYDTHTNQPGAHDRLLHELGDSVKAFVADLRAQGNGDRVLVMTFSEFGRRVDENASRGTDHGAGAPLFVVGSKIKAGLHGRMPSLAPQDRLNGDVKFSTDFRSVYAAVLENWLRTPSASILGRKFEPVAVV